MVSFVNELQLLMCRSGQHKVKSQRVVGFIKERFCILRQLPLSRFMSFLGLEEIMELRHIVAPVNDGSQ